MPFFRLAKQTSKRVADITFKPVFKQTLFKKKRPGVHIKSISLFLLSPYSYKGKLNSINKEMFIIIKFKEVTVTLFLKFMLQLLKYTW